MLRRKLMLSLGSVVVLLVASALGAILLLQSVLGDLGHVNQEAERNSGAAAQFGETLTAIESEVNRRILSDGDDVAIDLAEAVQVLEEQAARMKDAFEPPEPALDDLHHLLTAPLANLSELAQQAEPGSADEGRGEQLESILNQTVVLRERLSQFERLSRNHTLSDHERLVNKFRLTVIGLGFLFLVLINVLLVVLLHAAGIVLRPVSALTGASRRLAAGDFDHRIELDRRDEFGELAASYNRFAAELQRTEQKRLETLQQVARTLNHELNNAISIIELQLRKLEMTASGRGDPGPPLHQIHETLHRITGTVEALKRVRRIVLTDYVEGVKMLDLERSVEEAPMIEAPRHKSPPEMHTL